MKNVKKSMGKNLDGLVSKLSENEILDLNEMICIRGGLGDGNGSEPIIIPPPKLP